ncbi:hypothetical protein [Ferrimicrobium sp.]|uniref:hypothetical protein n=1 Tax=Ferrimicrobium sp. TaxID=2926050 RepID=UPI002620C1E5|nr:hypothetical protein [Ferrimicrobium sp.]
MQSRANDATRHAANYGPNTQEVLTTIGQLRSLDEHATDQLIIAMRNLELGTTIGANDDLERLWEARGNASELIHGQLADVWAAVLKETHACMKKFVATSEVVTASTDALLGAVCKPSIDPSDNQALTSAWHIGQGRCDGNKTTLEQLRELRRKNKQLKRRIEELEDRVVELETEVDVCDLLESLKSELLVEIANLLKGDPGPHRVHDWSDLSEMVQRLVDKLEAMENSAECLDSETN